MKKLAAIYTRVALEDHKHDTALKELRQYCKRMDWDIIEYKEKPSLVKVRPILDLLMHDARQKKFDVVVVWKLDRFAQSIRHLIETVTELDSYGIQFICTTEGIDTDRKSPMGAFLMQIMASFAERGKLSGTIPGATDVPEDVTGSWTLDGKQLALEYRHTKLRYRIISATPDKLVLQRLD